MKLQVNVKLLAALLAGAVVLGALAHLWRGYQLARTSGALLGQVDRAEEQGRPDRALHLLGRYIRHNPEDNDARARYVRLLEGVVRTPREKRHLLAALEQLLVRAPEMEDLRRKRAQLGVELGEFESTLPHLDILREKHPAEGRLAFLTGRCHEGVKDHTKARLFYEQALARSPEMVEAAARLAGLLRERFLDPAGADRVMDELTARNPDSSRALVARAFYKREAEGSLAGAADDVARALRLAPDDAGVLLLAGAWARERDQPGEARARLEKGVRLHPRYSALYLALADLELEAKGASLAARRGKALAWLRKGAGEVPGQVDLLSALTDLLIQGGELAEAREVIDRLRKGGLAEGEVAFLEARALVREGKWADASRLLNGTRHLLGRSPEVALQADLLLGRCLQALGDDQQLAAFRRAVASAPANVEASLGLASALLAGGRYDDAVAEYDRLARRPQAPAATWVFYARALVLRNLEAPPAGRDWGRALAVLDLADKAAPGGPEVAALRAEVLAAQAAALRGPARDAKFAEARQRLDDARRAHPRDVNLWLATASLELLRGQAAAAADVLRDADRAVGEDVALRLARVRLAARQGEKEGAAARRAAAGGADRFAEADRARLLQGLAQAHYAAGEHDEALRLGQRAAELTGDLGSRLFLFDVALAKGDLDEMGRQLGRVRAMTGDSPFWRYGEARRLVWQARKSGNPEGLRQARGHLDEVERRRGAWARVPLCRAEVCELEGNLDEAIDNYRLALTLGERRPEVVERLVRLLYDRRRYTEVDAAFARLQAITPISPELQRVAAEASLQRGDYDRAQSLAAGAIKPGSADYRDHLWLGRVLAASGKREEAEASLRQAQKLNGKAPEVWVALVEYLAATGRAAEAREAIAEAKSQLSRADAPLALARCYEATNDQAAAEAQYKAAVAAAPEQPGPRREAANYYLRTGRAAQAIPHLRKLLDPRAKAPAAEVAQARRGLAVALAATGDYARFTEALGLLGGQVSVEDRRARAFVLASHPAHRDGAIKELLDLAKVAPPTAEQQYRLARLYEAAGEWPKASDAMQAALVQAPNNPAYLTYYAQALLRQGRKSDAQLYITRLQQQAPGAFETVTLRGRVLAADARVAAQLKGDEREAAVRDKAGALVRLLEEYVGRDDAQPADPAARQGLAAALLDELAQEVEPLRAEVAAAAERWYRSYVAATEKARPESVLDLVAFLGRQGRAEEVLAACEKALPRGEAGRVASACVTALQAAGAGAEAYRRAQKWMGEAAEKKATPELLEAMAAACEQLGEYAEAEALYRKALAGSPRQVVALNNLAFLLAMRGQKLDEALALIDRALAVTGSIAELLDTRAVVRLARRERDKAVEDLKEALKQKPALASLKFHLAQAHQMAGARAEATRAFREAREGGLTAAALHPLERAAFAKLKE